jgi:hypothetical protein
LGIKYCPQPFCKHIAKAALANAKSKTLSKSLQNHHRRKRNFKNAPSHDRKTMKETATNRLTNHGRQGSTGGNITYTQAGVLCFVGQESAKNPCLRIAENR